MMFNDLKGGKKRLTESDLIKYLIVIFENFETKWKDLIQQPRKKPTKRSSYVR